MRKQVAGLAVVALLASASAGAEGFALGARAGTLGLGVEGVFRLTDGLNARVGVNNYTYNYNDTVSDVRYDADFKLRSSSLLLDWHPFGGAFRLSAGTLFNRNKVDLTGQPTGNVDVGGATFTPSQIGTLDGEVDFKKTAPYVALGWGNAVAKNKGLGLSFEIGAVMQGSPDVTLTSTNGTLSSDPTFQARLAQEERDAEKDLDGFKVYPVIALGLSYQF